MEMLVVSSYGCLIVDWRLHMMCYVIIEHHGSDWAISGYDSVFELLAPYCCEHTYQGGEGVNGIVEPNEIGSGF